MTRQEFAKGWLLLIAQPWGRRYEGDSEVATTQREFYYATFRQVSGDAWWRACCALAAHDTWPSISALRALVSPSAHPGPEAAWAMIAPKVASDAPTVFVTEEMREAFGAALALDGDMIAARMAFKEAYSRAVQEAEAQGRAPSWSMMPGTDPRLKEAAISEAVKRGYVSVEWAQRHVPIEAHPALLEYAGSLAERRS
jgi:hypothetical protein